MEQLYLFELPKKESNQICKMISELKDSHRRTQKKLFGEIGDLKESLINTQAEIEKIKFQFGLHEQSKPRRETKKT